MSAAVCLSWVATASTSPRIIVAFSSSARHLPSSRAFTSHACASASAHPSARSALRGRRTAVKLTVRALCQRGRREPCKWAKSRRREVDRSFDPSLPPQGRERLREVPRREYELDAAALAGRRDLGERGHLGGLRFVQVHR